MTPKNAIHEKQETGKAENKKSVALLCLHHNESDPTDLKTNNWCTGPQSFIMAEYRFSSFDHDITNEYITNTRKAQTCMFPMKCEKKIKPAMQINMENIFSPLRVVVIKLCPYELPERKTL